MAEVQRLLSEMPEVLSSDPETAVAEEAARAAAVVQFRAVVAQRWNYLLDLKGKVPKTHFRVLIGQMEDSHQNLVELHGTDLPFCPCPEKELLGDGDESADVTKSPPTGSAASTTASSNGSRSAPSMLPHCFKFLEIQGQGQNDVWTCVQVLSIVFRSNGKQFAGPTQLLPCGNVTEDQAKQAMQAFSEAVKLMYSSTGSMPQLPAKTFAWKHFRVPTKNLLLAFSNALVQSMPPGWNLQKAVPARLLAPRGSQADRLVLQQCEKESLRLPEWTKEAKLHFTYDFSNQTRLLDFQDDSSYFKLKTLDDACGRKCLDDIGASFDTPEAKELLQWHANLVLYQVEAIWGMAYVHRSFPWKCVQMLDSTSWRCVLDEMSMVWSFVVEVADVLKPNSGLYYDLSVTRYFNFDPTRMRSKASLPFEEAVLAVCGMQSADKPTSLLSSLPSELTFNSLRDCCRRHAKQERASAAALHCAAVKSSMVHTFGAQKLEVEQFDWSTHIPKSNIKTQVHQSLRCTDKELGVSSEGLTKHKTNKHYTKSHIFAYRLDLLQVLAKLYQQTNGSDEDRRDLVMETYESMWISKVMPELWFLRPKDQMEENPNTLLLATRAGPFTVGCVNMVSAGEGSPSYKMEGTFYQNVIVTQLDQFSVAEAKAAISESGNMEWQRSSDWQQVVDYICDDGILRISATLLASVCSQLRLGGSRLDHVHRAELFLKHFQRSEEWIETVLTELRARQRKRKEKKEQEVQAGDDQDR
eukprot:Skav225362  [mRNA]  locus=scaffold3158:96642:102674:+ [translate_table: standard]